MYVARVYVLQTRAPATRDLGKTRIDQSCGLTTKHAEGRFPIYGESRSASDPGANRVTTGLAPLKVHLLCVSPLLRCAQVPLLMRCQAGTGYCYSRAASISFDFFCLARGARAFLLASSRSNPALKKSWRALVVASPSDRPRKLNPGATINTLEEVLL